MKVFICLFAVLALVAAVPPALTRPTEGESEVGTEEVQKAFVSLVMNIDASMARNGETVNLVLNINGATDAVVDPGMPDFGPPTQPDGPQTLPINPDQPIDRPEITKPEIPGITKPEIPNITKPEIPGITKPIEKPDITKPIEKPDITKPIEKPDITKPIEKPDITKPIEKPDITKPMEKPDITKPIHVLPETRPMLPFPQINPGRPIIY